MAARRWVDPDSVVALGPVACLVHDQRGTTVCVRGQRWWSWAVGDDVGRRAAAVGLVRADLASRGDVAAAFGITVVTLWRWSKAADEHGTAGLRSGRPGPKGAWKLTDDVADRIVELDREGLSQREIARRVGVSSYSVRQVQRSLTAADDTSPTALGQPASPGVPPTCGAAHRDARVTIPTGQRLPSVGLLLAVPAVHATGLVRAAADVSRAHDRAVLDPDRELMPLALLALAGRCGGRRDARIDLDDVARLVGHDVPSELSTVGQALADLGERLPAGELMAALAGHHRDVHRDAIGVLYAGSTARAVLVDRASARPTVSLDVPSSVGVSPCDAFGGPVFVVPAAPSPQAADDVRRSIGDVRAASGGHRVTVSFERTGWSAGLFADLLDEDVEVVCRDTRRRRGRARPVGCGDVDVDGCTSADHGDAGGRTEVADDRNGVCDHTVALHLSEYDAQRLGRTVVNLRRVAHHHADGRWTAVLTSRTDRPAAEAVSRLANPWCHGVSAQVSGAFDARDLLDAATDHAPNQMVANPALTDARTEVQRLTTVLVDGRAAIARNRGIPDLAGMVAQLEVALDQVRAQLDVAEQRSATLPTRVPVVEPSAAARRLDTDAGLIAHTIRSAADDAASSLARLLAVQLEPRTCEQCAGDDRVFAPCAGSSHAGDNGAGELHAVVGDVLRSTGVIDVVVGELRVTLDAPRDPLRARAVSALCDALNGTATTYPGTHLVLRYGLGSGVTSGR